MSNNKNEIAIVLVVDDKGTGRIKQFAGESEANFKKVERAGTASASALTTGWQKLAGVLGPTIAAYFSGQAIKDVLMLADSYTLLDSRLGLITESSTELAMVQDELFRISQETGTAYAGNAATVAKLGLAMEAAGASSQELLAINELVNKSLVVSGASTAEQSSFLLQFGQAMGSGVLQGEEFRAMMEANSYFGSQLAKALDTDIAGLRKMSKDGKLTTDVLREAFPKMATEINTAFDGMPITIGRAMTMVENSFGKVINEANKAADGTSGIARAVADMATVIDQNKEVLGNLFTGMVDGGSEVIKVISNIAQSMAGWQAVNEGNLDFWEYATMSAEELNHWLKKNNAEGKNQSFAQLNREAQEQIEFQKKINEEQKKERAGLGELTEAQKGHNLEVAKEQEVHAALTQEQIKQAADIVAAERKAATDIAAAQAESLKTSGLLADEHYAAEKDKLVAKAAAWQQTGGEIVTIENWLYDQLGLLEAEADAKGQVTAAIAMDRAQGNYRVLIDELAAATRTTTDQTAMIQNKIQGLDGSSFTIHANLDSSSFVATIDSMIGKFRELAAAASSAQRRSSSSSSSKPGNVSLADQGRGGSYDMYQAGADSQTGRAKSAGDKAVTININQQLSRSDVTAIISEQRRQEARK